MQDANWSMDLESCDIYQFINKKSVLLAADKWTLALTPPRNLSISSATQNIPLTPQLVRICYPQNQALLFQNKEGSYALRSPINHQQNDLMEFRLQESDTKIVDWASTSAFTQKSLKAAFGENIDTHENIDKRGKTAGLSFKIGGFFGAINNLFVKPSAEIGKVVSEKANQLKQQKVSEETKSNWKILKDRAKEVNHSAAEIIKPVKTKASALTTKLGEKFDSSDNFLIRNVRDFGYGVRDSLNEGYKNFQKSSAQVPPTPKLERGPESERALQ